jgi:hypothetical protein
MLAESSKDKGQRRKDKGQGAWGKGQMNEVGIRKSEKRPGASSKEISKKKQRAGCKGQRNAVRPFRIPISEFPNLSSDF